MPVPREVGNNSTRVLLAVLADRHPTTNSISRRTGLSRGGVYWHLCRLRDMGLVSFSEGKKGTIHPLVTIRDRSVSNPVDNS